jgi:hypothetical protein
VQVTLRPAKTSQWSLPAQRSSLDTPQASKNAPHNAHPLTKLLGNRNNQRIHLLLVLLVHLLPLLGQKLLNHLLILLLFQSFMKLRQRE